MKKFSKNQKLNKVLNNIYGDLMDLGKDEILRYKKEFPCETDYNIYSYGNMLIYNDDIRELYQDYKSLKNASDEKLVKIYKRQIRYMVYIVLKTTQCC